MGAAILLLVSGVGMVGGSGVPAADSGCVHSPYHGDNQHAANPVDNLHDILFADNQHMASDMDNVHSLQGSDNIHAPEECGNG